MKNDQKKVSANDPKTWQEPLKHHNWPFLTTFQSTKVIRNPPRGFRPKKKSDFVIFRVWKSTFQYFLRIFKNYWEVPTLSNVSGSDLATVLPKTTIIYLSRNSRSNSGTGILPPKCSEPKTSKSPCIRLGNEKGQKKVSANGPKARQDPSKHHNQPFQTTFQSTKVIRDPSRGFRPKLRKSQILSFLECGNRTLRPLPTYQRFNWGFPSLSRSLGHW